MDKCNVTPIRREYEARIFRVHDFLISGTLCGCIDIAPPSGLTVCMTIPEIDSLICALTAARKDVVSNSQPFNDPRLYHG